MRNNKIIVIKYYFVILLSVFITYIYLQNIRENRQFEEHFDCIILPGRVDNCISDKIVSINARITSQIYKSGSFLVIKKGRINVYVPEVVDLEVGDEIRVFGTYEKRLLYSGNIEKRLISSDIEIISRGKNESMFSINKWLNVGNSLSGILRERIDKYFIPTHSKLIAGILFGSRENIPIILYKNLINTGTIHVIAASGYNVAVFSGFMMSFLIKILKRKQAIIGAIFSIFLFVVVSGGGEAVVRAGIMGMIAFLAQYLGKMYTSLYSLLITVVIMLFLKPSLIFSISFQLSVCSTLGILTIGNQFNKSGPKLIQGESLSKLNKSIKSMLLAVYYDLSTTLSATIMTFPIILIYFDRVSMISLLANMAVLWTIPPLMLLGSIQVLLSIITPYFADKWAYLLWPFLTFFTKTVNWLGSLSFASYEISWFNEYMAVGYYLLIFSMYLMSIKRPVNE